MLTDDGVPESRHFHLFVANVLVATATLPVRTPPATFDVDGKRYEALTYLEVTEANGTLGCDVQVRPI